MFCKNCGAQINNGVSFCPACGAQQTPIYRKDDRQYAQPVYVQPSVDPRVLSYAGKALTFGILGLVFCFVPILGLIFCIAAKRNASAAKKYGNGIAPGGASAGNVLGTIGLVFAIIDHIVILLYGILVILMYIYAVEAQSVMNDMVMYSIY